MRDRCEISQCRSDADLSYLGHAICSRHWNELTDENAPPGALRKALGIKAEPETENTTMSKKNESKSKKAKAEKAPTTDATAAETPTRTLALRVTDAEFELIHAAAGPRNLSGFMRQTLLRAAERTQAKTAAAE